MNLLSRLFHRTIPQPQGNLMTALASLTDSVQKLTDAVQQLVDTYHVTKSQLDTLLANPADVVTAEQVAAVVASLDAATASVVSSLTPPPAP